VTGNLLLTRQEEVRGRQGGGRSNFRLVNHSWNTI